MSVNLDGFWIGKPGSLIRLPGWVGKIGVAHESGVTFRQSAAGRRFAFVSGTRPARKWSVEIPYLTPEQVGDLQALMYEPVPEYLWLSVEAATSNALTPEASLGGSQHLQRIGAMKRDDGRVAPVAIANPGAATGDSPQIVGMAPVVSGSKVSASVWMSGRLGPYLLVQWLNADGVSFAQTQTARLSTSLDALHRATLTLDVPTGAVAANVAPMAAEYYAQTALSWTPQPVEWGLGGLCQRGIVDGLTESIRRSRPDADPMGRLRDISFTVTEVG
ncbi:hypothetical protein [Janibacter terrae]|uniref:hypothetical protein n=1 Tax=Janibacter terrae TaxID=103817 RepID=UPI0031F9A1C6